jgi:hypothetical protein
MRRLLILAAFFLLITLVPVYAQHGGHGGGGGHSSSAGGHAVSGGHSFGGGGFSGSHVGSGAHFGSYSGSHPGFANRSQFGDRFRGDRSGTRFTLRTRCYGCWGYGYPYYGFYDPYWDSWWWGSGSGYDDDDASQRQLASQMNEENLEEQQMLAQEERDGDQDIYAQRRQPRDPQPSKEEHAQNDPLTVIVFRDQHQREIQNYAITDGILWNFTATRTEKIPLSTVDIPATVKANDDRGLDFHLPGTGEGQ